MFLTFLKRSDSSFLQHTKGSESDTAQTQLCSAYPWGRSLMIPVPFINSSPLEFIYLKIIYLLDGLYNLKGSTHKELSGFSIHTFRLSLWDRKILREPTRNHSNRT